MNTHQEILEKFLASMEHGMLTWVHDLSLSPFVTLCSMNMNTQLPKKQKASLPHVNFSLRVSSRTVQIKQDRGERSPL
jgi:hypothetical protein